MVQRFKAALLCGQRREDNPEDLLRDDNGEYILYKDYIRMAEGYSKRIQSLSSEVANLQADVRNKELEMEHLQECLNRGN
jgi:hypothetical protein